MKLHNIPYSLVSETLAEFKQCVLEDKEIVDKISALGKKVEEFASKFPMPGFKDY